MSESVISVKNLSKKYRIGENEADNETFAGMLVHAITQPIRNFRNIRNLTRFKNDDDKNIFWALRDINFEVKKGEVMGIIGHNGAGKSTLLKILSRITDPSAGEIRIKGKVSSLLEVGTGFHPELTGRENVFMNGTILGMTKKEIERKFDEIVAFSGIEKHIDTPVKFYSSGMKVRLAFSVAAFLEPDILIIDEVLAVGDFEFQRKCLGKMEDVSQQGRTILFVSHDMGAIQSLTNRAIVLKKGKIFSEGPTAEAIDLYMKSFESAEDAVVQFENKNLKINHLTVTNNEADLYNDKADYKSQFIVSVLSPVYIYVSLSLKVKVHNPSIGLRLTNSRGVHMFMLSTDYTMGAPTIDHANPKIVCRIPLLNLLPDDYRLSFWIEDNKEKLFLSENSFGVTTAREIPAGYTKVPGLSAGNLFLEHSWSIK